VGGVSALGHSKLHTEKGEVAAVELCR